MENYESKSGCDFIGNDFWNTKTRNVDECGKACLSNNECTHFTFTSDSMCWMKTGQVNEEQAILPENKQTICGIVFRDENKKDLCQSLGLEIGFDLFFKNTNLHYICNKFRFFWVPK